jgi:predicted transcriptional regulator
MSKGTPPRAVRIPDEMWDKLGSIAKNRNTDRSEVIRAAVEHCLGLKAFRELPYLVQEEP